MSALVLFFLCFILKACFAANIAVINYESVSSSNSDINVDLNVAEYLHQLSLMANEKKLDLVIFPEETLKNGINSAVEINVDTNFNNNSAKIDPTIAIFSYTANTYQTYLVINLVEKTKCEESDQSANCKSHGFKFYNTDVVFDREGTIIKKYRKFNLFGEFEKDRPDNAEKVVIDTDFGEKLGIFTCFDILFKSPAQDLVADGIDGAIFPTMWFSELPFLTALQTQQMWAEAHNVSLYSSGAQNPSIGSGGSGIYTGIQGATATTISAKPGSSYIIYDTEKNEVTSSVTEDTDTLAKDMDNFYLKQDNSIQDFTTEIISNTTQLNLCHDNVTENQICCNFSVEITSVTPEENKNYYTYRMAAFSGIRSYSGVYNGGIELCAIIACLNESLASCGLRFEKYETIDWPVTFNKIEIVADFEITSNRTQYPNSLLSSIRPIAGNQTVWKNELVDVGGKKMVRRTFATAAQKQDRILTFGIYGRKFEQDSDPNHGEPNSQTMLKHDFITCVLLLISIFVIW